MAASAEEECGEFVYRISTASEWEELQKNGSTFGGELDKSSCCLHLSKLDQVQPTLQNFFLNSKEDLYLLQIDAKKPNELKKQWDPPPNGIYKINVDAAIQVEAQMAGLGAVVRDSNSRVVMAAVKTVPFRGEVRFTEAEAMEWGIQAAIEAKLHSVIVETDCLEVANLANNKQGSRTEIFWVVSEIQNKCKLFDCVKILHTPRTCNLEAHYLAKFALEFKETEIWANGVPAPVMNVLTPLS